MASVHGRVSRLSWMSFAVSLYVLTAQQCHAHRKLPLRKSRQAPEDEGAGNKSPGIWSTWSSWSSCSRSCGVGVMERIRTCQSPRQWASGGLRLESSVHGTQAQSQSRYQEEWMNIYGHMERWPSYPLHTDNDAANAPAGPLVPLPSNHRQASMLRYGPLHRHTRHESLTSEDLPATQNHEHISNRRSALSHGQEAIFDQEVGWAQKPAGLSSREMLRPDASSSLRSVPFHRATHRRNVSRQNGSALHSSFIRASLPLFKPENPEGQEAENPGHGVLADLGRRNGDQRSNQLRQEPRFSRRSWVQDAIKPGRYGYGKVPFALPLHRMGSDGGQRFKRHHSARSEDTESLPRKQKRKVAHLIVPSAEGKLETHNQEKARQDAELRDKLLYSESMELIQDRPQTKGQDKVNRLSYRKERKGLPTEQQEGMQDSLEGEGHEAFHEGEMDRRKEGHIISAVRNGDGVVEPELEIQPDDFPRSKERYSSQRSSKEYHQVFLTNDEKSTEQISKSEELEGEIRSQWDRYKTQQNIHVSLRKVVSDSPTIPRPTKTPERALNLSEPMKKWKRSLQTITEVKKFETTTSVELQIGDNSKQADGVDDLTESLRRLENYFSANLKPGERENVHHDLSKAKKASKTRTRRTVRPTENWTTTSRPMGEQITPMESPQVKNRTIVQNLSLSGQWLNILNKQSSSPDQQPYQYQQTGVQSKQRSTQLPKEHNSQSSRQGSQQQQIARSSSNVLRSASRTNGKIQPVEEEKIEHQNPYSSHQYPWSRAQRGSLIPAEQHARPRSQRQHNPLQREYSSRTPQSLFRELPSIHRHEELGTWPLHGGNLIQPHESGHDQRSGLHTSAEVSQWNLYHPHTESFHCEGEQKQYKACSQESCPDGTPDARALQCATLNRQEFMGRLYQWEPFTEVRGSQQCELNCRPMGYRFYVRHTEKVQDGTPCEASSTDICVSGRCLSPGCDGILGSNAILDSCGMCGGDGSTCRLIVGIFNDSNVPIGYHKILEIPRGATKINVTENTRSPNYLALRRHFGKSVINGNWVVDPPGTYEAGGTVFTYVRPGREDISGAESFMAQGPTTEPLDVYMIFQQDNPGVSYRYYLPSLPRPENPASAFGNLQRVPSDRAPLSSHDLRNPMTSVGDPSGRQNPRVQPPGRHSPRAPGVLQRNIRIPPLSAPPVHHWPEPPAFYWRRVGNTECTVTCGKGSWIPVFRCFSHRFQEEVDEKECDAATRPVPTEEACSTQSCPAYWDTGEWAACSSSCGPGVQHRPITCRQVYANWTTMVHPQQCTHLEKPNATQPCHLRICSHWEFSVNWSSCSVLCGQGQRTRPVRCISNQGDMVSDKECNSRPRPWASEVCDMGPCVRTWFHSDWSNKCSAECGTGIQRRSIVCLSNHTGEASGESCTGIRPTDMRACDSGPCHRAVRWYTGPWSQCSTECDGGIQRRDVICVSKLGSEFSVTDPSECAHLDKPTILQPCAANPCRAQWFTTPWNTCSQSCLGGMQMREVRCLTRNGTLSSLCDPDIKPVEKRTCNTEPCAPQLDENCKDRHHSCPLVVQARLCVYAYYKEACCASCTHALERRRAPPPR